MSGNVTAVDHVGYVVTDLDQAVRFFVDVLGFEETNRRGEVRSEDGDRMTRLFGVHPRAVGRYAFMQLGEDRVELLEWSAPEQNSHLPLNSDRGGRHIALAVRDLDEYVVRIAAEPGVSVRERIDVGFYYVGTPFGLELQLVPAK